ncbi:hypothetical protein [Amycolatopsis sp. CA-126428]|nr:hypothetical protein [Amycolatopsis sp. CA-126428]
MTSTYTFEDGLRQAAVITVARRCIAAERRSPFRAGQQIRAPASATP